MTPNLEGEQPIKTMENLKGTNFMILHNHPGGYAKFSPADKGYHKKLREKYGEKFMGGVVIDKNKYSSITWEKSLLSTHPDWVQKNEKQIPEKLLGRKHKDPDPLYHGYEPSQQVLDFIESPAENVMAFGEWLKTPDNWTTMVFLSPRGGQTTISAIIEYKDLHKLTPYDLADLIANETRIWNGGGGVHLLVQEGDWYKDTKDAAKHFERLFTDTLRHPDSYIKSIWVDEQPVKIDTEWQPYPTMHELPTVRIK